VRVRPGPTGLGYFIPRNEDRRPRHDFKRHLAIALASASLSPDGRPSWLCRWASFQTLIKAAPFAE
jgi:hypothetical protein